MERLYIFNCPTSNSFKVGVSSDIRRRVTEIRAQGFDVDDETSFYSESTDKKFILEVEKTTKFLLRDNQRLQGVSKESGFSEWYSTTVTISAESIAAFLNMFFGMHLNLQKNLATLSEGTASPEFYQTSASVESSVSEKNKLKAKYVEALLTTFEALPNYLMEFLAVTHNPEVRYYIEESTNGVSFTIVNSHADIDAMQGFVLTDCLNAAEEILELCSTFPSDTSFHQSSISSAFGVMKEFVLTIRLGHLLSYFKEVQAKTGPRPLAAISRLETLLRLICRDTHMIGTLPGVGERDEE